LRNSLNSQKGANIMAQTNATGAGSTDQVSMASMTGELLIVGGAASVYLLMVRFSYLLLVAACSRRGRLGWLAAW
jgi:hypothetical protein